MYFLARERGADGESNKKGEQNTLCRFELLTHPVRSF